MSLQELLCHDGRDFVINNTGEQVPVAELASNELVGLYFSAHWCGPCRSFTPEFAKVYEEVKLAGQKFEVVFLSSDKDEAAFKDYHAEMPWLAVPHGDQTKEALSKRFGVRGIPSLILVDKDGNVVNDNGRAAISSGASEFPWAPKRVQKLDPSAGSSLNKKTCLVVLMEESKDGQAEVQAALDGIGADPTYNDIELFYAFEDNAFVQRIRDFVGVTKDSYKEALVILDLPNKGSKFVVEDCSAGNISEVLSAFKAGELVPFSKSAPRPDGDADPAHPGLTIVVATSFDELVLDEATDVFLDVYADWCGPCVAVKPHLIRVAKVLDEMKVPNLRVAKFDSDANATPKEHIPEDHIPVLKFFPRNKDGERQASVPFEGARTGEGILNFLHTQVKGSDADFALEDALAAVNAMQQEEEREKKEAEALEAAKLAELVKDLPTQIKDARHEHVLDLVPKVYRGQYGCDGCAKGGSGYAYHCKVCGWDLHPECGKPEANL